MKTVRFEDAADEELIDEVARYELRRDGLGTEFLVAVREAVSQIAENPRAWQASEYGRDLRRFVMDRFPFTIVYTELADEILILAIAHTSREPGYWRTRR
jgi:plasmid stabilization system protein ParE